MHVLLVEPQIAPNTGNIIRLCANTGARLHLVRPLGFRLDDASLRRAGLDYHEYASVTVHDGLDEARSVLPGRWLAFTSSGRRRYTEETYRSDDVLVFGTERTGLDRRLLGSIDPEHVMTIPMRPHNRSLNLANAVSVVVYETWRQAGFAGAADTDGSDGDDDDAALTTESLRAPPHT